MRNLLMKRADPMLHRMPLILLAIIVSILLFNTAIPLSLKETLYAVSLTIKSVILFMLPMIIFSLLLKTMVGLANRATTIITLILICLCASNYAATFISHFVGEWVYHLDLSVIRPNDAGNLSPAFVFQLPKLVENNHALFAGMIAGMILGQAPLKRFQWIVQPLDWVTTRLLCGIAYLIPLFVTGFVIKLQYDGVMQMILKDYLAIFAVIISAQLSYLFLFYLVLNRFNIQGTWKSIKNILPAAMAGFATMSSAAVLPLTMNSVANDTINPDLARSTVSVTTNIHLLGDCIAISIFAYALMKSFGMPMPTLYTFAIFTCYFVMAKFSVAAVPAGGIMVMLPVLENHLGFSPEMLSLMLALYVLLDPVVTAMNVMGNGALAKLIDQLAAWRSSMVTSPTR